MESQVGMSKVNLNYINKIQNQNQKEIPLSSDNKSNIQNDNKKLKLALAGLAAIGAATIITAGVVKHNKNILQEAKNFFNKYTKTATGNNNILDDGIKAANNTIDEYIKKHEDAYKQIKKYISTTTESANIKDIIPDGNVYHGTSIDTGKSILENGITPFVTKKAGNSQPGLGKAIYTTPTLDIARFYSRNGIVLPYKLEGKVAKFKNTDIDAFRSNITEYICNSMEPNAEIIPFLGKKYSQETVQEAMELTPFMINRAMQDSGYIGLYTPEGITKGLMTGLFNKIPDNIDTAGQLAVFDGTKLTLDIDKLKELNPITKENYLRFLAKK